MYVFTQKSHLSHFLDILWSKQQSKKFNQSDYKFSKVIVFKIHFSTNIPFATIRLKSSLFIFHIFIKKYHKKLQTLNKWSVWIGIINYLSLSLWTKTKQFVVRSEEVKKGQIVAFKTKKALIWAKKTTFKKKAIPKVLLANYFQSSQKKAKKPSIFSPSQSFWKKPKLTKMARKKAIWEPWVEHKWTSTL